LSCLLFDIAIEPLGELLRKSDLKGFEISGKTERLIATFFADDTTVFLSENDDFGRLQELLDCWCAALGAKFRQQRFPNNNNDSQIPVHIKIAREGEAINPFPWCPNR
ncbi:hypothetical protein GG344DRAFT_60138, partial [Lentinula edodes]